MTSSFRSGSSRRKAETPGKIRIQLKGKNSKILNSDDEDDPVIDNVSGSHADHDDDEDNLPVTFDKGIPADLPEGTCVVQPEPVEDVPVKKKSEAPVRIDTSVLDNVSCTACGRQLNPYKSGALQKHPELKVAICKRCEKFLSSGEIGKDKDGTDEQCRWCGEGGRLVVCDECASAFCKACVMRNFNRSEFNNINSQQNWKCYLCNKAPLQGLRDNYRKIRDTLKALHMRDEAKAANATSNGTKPSEKSAGSKQVSKGLLSISAIQKGKVAGTITDQISMSSARVKSSSSFQESQPEAGRNLPASSEAENVIISSKDINVNPENVFAIIDRLLVASTTFREMLQSLSQLPLTTGVSIHTLGPRYAKALSMSTETYLKSLKTILSGSPHMWEDVTHGCIIDKPPLNFSDRDLISSISAAEAFAPISAKSLLMPQGSNMNLLSNGDISNPFQSSSSYNYLPFGNKPEVGKCFSKDNEYKTVSFNQHSGSALKDKNECDTRSKFSKQNEKEDARQLSGNKGTVNSVDVTKTSKQPTKGESVSGKANAGDFVSENIINDIETIKNDAAQRTQSDKPDQRLNKKKDNSKGEMSFKKPDVRASSEKDIVTKNLSDNEIAASQFSKELNQESHSQASTKDGVKLSKETNSTASGDGNVGKNNDLAEKPASDKLSSEGDKFEGSGNTVEDDAEIDNLIVTFGDQQDSSSTSNSKIKKPTALDTSKTSKKQNAAKIVKPSKDLISNNSSCQDETEFKLSEKGNCDSNGVKPVGRGSRSSLSSSDDDVDLTTRMQQQKRKETQKTGKNQESATQKQENSRTETKSKLNLKISKSVIEDKKGNTRGAKGDNADGDNEAPKLPGASTVRKRKVPDSEENGEGLAEKTKTASQSNLKKPKPGPRSSKKSAGISDPSPDTNGKKAGDTSDDEDEPPVTFFLEDDDDKGSKDNEESKNGQPEDVVAENDVDIQSSEDSDDAAKTKKKVIKKAEKDKDKSADDGGKDKSSTAAGKRKKASSKVVDAKISDSDSDVERPKKKKKDDDSDSFKGEDSSGSSIESDLSESEDGSDDSEGSDGEDEDGESKKKKKGKKKQRKKKKKRKGKIVSDDDEGEDENDEENEGGKKKKKDKGKRKGKKKMSSSEDDEEEEAEVKEEDEDEDEEQNSSKAGKRKQIRKVMSSKKLEDSTRAAAKAEEKRRKRIAAKQREFNIETITDENNPMNCPVTTKLVLENGKEEGDEPIIQVNKNLVRKLKPHQVEAVQFLWDCMYESVKRSKKEQGAGCILAHCMGLGKTLSLIAFVHTILTNEKVLKHRTCLVVSPLNTVLNWRNEWTMWFDEEDQLDVWELASCKQNAARADALKEWQANGGVMIMGYEMYRNLTTGTRCKNKRQKKIFQETLVDPGPDLVVCDEGHILKNEASAISKAMNQMKTRRRVVLTGTPLQNNLNEYHCMVSFVKPNLLGTRKEFTNRFINPIQNGQCTDSTLRDVKIMKARAHVLHEMLAGCVQRRDYSALTKFLPPKQEYVISVRLTNIQIELYEKYLEMTGQGLDGVFSNKGARLFADYQNLMKIWTHPWVLKLAEIRDELKMKFDDDDSFIDDDSDEDRSFSSSSSSSEEDKAVSDSSGKANAARLNMQRGTKRTRAKARRQAGEDSDPEEVIAEWKSKTRTTKDDDVKVEETDKSVTKEWWAQYVTEDDKLKLELSNKLHLLFEILRMCEEIGDKVLIFSQSILSLNIIESFLEVVDSKFQQECENLTEEEKEKEVFGRSWTKNLDYYRMDGSTSAQHRQMWAASFNDLENYRARLFLISTRAGGLGINLVAANRVIIFDASWNPSHDVQSIFRVYRFGQTKPCYIYRFLAQGTMEEKIYERQVTKLSLSQRVVDEHQIERHFSANDLKELYNFRPERWDDGTEKPTLALPKDPLLAEILTTNRHCVVSFHEHDSLLENQIEQTLTEEEKKAAWEEYENEKKGIIMRGPGMERTATWPMMAAAQILSREQITATVQALRQQLPDISEDLFHLHVQQALRRQVQIKQEELRRMELLRLQEMNYLNMIKQQAQQSGLTHAQSIQAMQNMAPWIQIQRLRAMQQSMLMGAGHLGMLPSASMSLLGQALSGPLSNKPEDAIDLEDN